MMGTQPWQIADLSLAELLKQGKAVERGHCNTEIRLGILGDGADPALFAMRGGGVEAARHLARGL